MKQGDERELTIDAVAFGGSGVGRFGEMVVFVPFTVDGDTVSVTISAVKKRYAIADLKSLHTPSPFRVTPRCGVSKKGFTSPSTSVIIKIIFSLIPDISDVNSTRKGSLPQENTIGCAGFSAARLRQ